MAMATAFLAIAGPPPSGPAGRVASLGHLISAAYHWFSKTCQTPANTQRRANIGEVDGFSAILAGARVAAVRISRSQIGSFEGESVMARTIGQYVARDSSGVDRILWGQEWGSSCGPASCYMVCCSVTQSSLGGGEAFIRQLAMRYGASIFDLMSGAGTYAGQLKQILENQDMRVDSNQYAVAEFVSKIVASSELKPIIFHVAWYTRDNHQQWVGNGGHWVACVGAVNAAAIILDPWYGLMEVPLVSLPDYNPETPNQSRNPATAGSWGLLSGWLINVL
jgi:hypothetical protein